MSDVIGWTVATLIAILTVVAWGAVLVRAKRGDHGPGVLDPLAPVPDNRPSLASLQSGWTPQEREVFGINETEALIRRIDRELASDHERAIIDDCDCLAALAGVPGQIIRGGSITADRIWVG